MDIRDEKKTVRQFISIFFKSVVTAKMAGNGNDQKLIDKYWLDRVSNKSKKIEKKRP